MDDKLLSVKLKSYIFKMLFYILFETFQISIISNIIVKYKYKNLLKTNEIHVEAIQDPA
jgi:hypothetical protein